MSLAPHEQRVVDELAARRIERDKLFDFLGTDTWKTLPNEDRALLQEQHKIMWDLTDVLERRVKRFTSPQS